MNLYTFMICRDCFVLHLISFLNLEVALCVQCHIFAHSCVSDLLRHQSVTLNFTTKNWAAGAIS